MMKKKALPRVREQLVLVRVDKRRIPVLTGSFGSKEITDAWLRQYGFTYADVRDWAMTHKDWYLHFRWDEAQEEEFVTCLSAKARSAYRKPRLRAMLGLEMAETGPTQVADPVWWCGP